MLHKDVNRVEEEGEAVRLNGLGVDNRVLVDSNLSELALNHVGHLNVDSLLSFVGLEASNWNQLDDLFRDRGDL